MIMEPIAPSPDGQEKSQPSYSHAIVAMTDRINKKVTSFDDHRGGDPRRTATATPLGPERAKGRRPGAKRRMRTTRAVGRPPKNPDTENT